MDITVTTIVVSFSLHQLRTSCLSSERDTTVTTANADTAKSRMTQTFTKALKEMIRQL